MVKTTQQEKGAEEKDKEVSKETEKGKSKDDDEATHGNSEKIRSDKISSQNGETKENGKEKLSKETEEDEDRKEDENKDEEMEVDEKEDEEKKSKDEEVDGKDGVENGKDGEVDEKDKENEENMDAETKELKDRCTADPNFAVICSFLEKFGGACGVPCPTIAELEVIKKAFKNSLNLVHINDRRGRGGGSENFILGLNWITYD